MATSTQAFFSRQLEFWRLWNDERRGRDAALAFAANDRATLSASTIDEATSEAASDAATADDAEMPRTNATTSAADSSEAATSAAAIAVSDPKFGAFLAGLDLEKFVGWLGHSDNATHFKSSGDPMPARQ